jgi:hypothetical protein
MQLYQARDWTMQELRREEPSLAMGQINGPHETTLRDAALGSIQNNPNPAALRPQTVENLDGHNVALPVKNNAILNECLGILSRFNEEVASIDAHGASRTS